MMRNPNCWRIGVIIIVACLRGIVSQDCPLQIWVFDSLTDCVNPKATGTMYADNQCHTLDSRPDFPGNYIAKCDSGGGLDFVVSGCSDGNCESCQTQRTEQSYLYSRISEPIRVQEIQDTSNGPIRFECFSFTNGIVEIFYAIYGDCSAPGCSGVPPPTPAPVDPPTRAPVRDPTSAPVRDPTRAPVDPPTRAPVDPPTSAPVRDPTRAPVDPPTRAPVRDPTRAPVPRPTSSPIKAPTNAPVRSPTSSPVVAPTWSPVKAPTMAPVTASPTTESPTRSPLDSKMTLYPTQSPVTAPPSTDVPTMQPIQRFSDTAKVEMQLSPMNQMLNDTSLQRWAFVTSSRVRFAGKDIIQVQTSRVEQELLLPEDEPVLLITFDILVVSSSAETTALDSYLETFDERTEKVLYRADLTVSQGGIPALAPVEQIVAAKSRYPEDSSIPDTPTDEDTNKSSNNSNTSILVAVGLAAAAGVVVIGGFLYRTRRRRRRRRRYKPEPADSEPEITVKVEDCHPDAKLILPGQDQGILYTHDIELRPDEDDISTLGGYTGIATATVKEDDATASVHEDYDFDKNMYRTGSNDHQSFSMASTMFSNHTALERLGAMLFNDDKSLDQQFLDERMNNDNSQSRRKRISPFEIRAPPGLLGMVVDSPVGGGTPVVRAIQPDSVLTGKVMIGDHLLSVNYKDVTGLSAKDVSNLISFKQNEERLLKFVRIEDA